MQANSIVSTSTAAAAPKNAPVTDSANWQSALTQADGQPALPVTGQAENKPAAKSGKKDAAGERADVAAQKVFTATEKTLLQRSKKPQAPVAGSSAPPAAKHDKDAAAPVVLVAAQPVTALPDASPASGTPGDVKPTALAPAAASGAQQQSGAPVSQDDAKPLTLPGKASTVAPADEATPVTPAQPEAGTAVVPSLTPAVASPLAVPNPTAAPQTAPASHGAKTEKTESPEIAASGPKVSLVSNTDIPTAAPADAAGKDDVSIKQPTAILPVTLATPAVHEATPQPTPSTAIATAPVTQPSAAGLAAAVTAMHQSGQSGAVLRLDPPGLGHLSVHVSLAQSGQVNVLFIPSTQVAATTLQNNLSGLGTALAQSGITLGQAQVGGQFNQNAGQGAYQPPSAPAFTQTSTSSESEAPSGVSAYA